MCFQRNHDWKRVKERLNRRRLPASKDVQIALSKPDRTFLSLMASVGEYAQAGNTTEMEKSAKQALSIAESEKWYQMQAIIYAVVGMFYMQQKNFEHAIEMFKKSSSTATLAKVMGDPLGSKIEVESLFAEASVLFARAQYQKAAEAYVAIIAPTITMGCPLHTMEAWMMAACCQEILENFALAAMYNRMALDAAEKLAPPKRPKGVIAAIGDSLLRLIDTSALLKKEEAIPTRKELSERMERLLGPNWQNRCIPADRLFGMTARFIMNEQE